MICNHDQQPGPIVLPTNSIEYDGFDEGDSLQPLRNILPGVIEQINQAAHDPIRQAYNSLNDLQKRYSQGDPTVTGAALAEARAAVEQILVDQTRPQPPSSQ